ncbi:MAG TPA: dethiobiotin synthase [Kofleriaceae bacterium]|nr:dethiobiotin synthase [Kofleriaceae bacterium]
MKGYFVTGTDTNVGKTYVSTALARRGVARGHKVFAFKPMETGCTRDESGNYVGADQELLAEAAGNWQQAELRGLYRFALPAAPLVAASEVGAHIDLDLISATARTAAAQHAVSLTPKSS